LYSVIKSEDTEALEDTEAQSVAYGNVWPSVYLSVTRVSHA